MIERKNDRVIVDDMKRMSELARVANAGEVPDLRAMFSQKIEKPS